MSFSGVNYGDLSPRVGIVAVAKFLVHATQPLILERFATSQMIDKNKGQTVKWRRAIPYTVAMDQLVEGVTPAPQGIAFEDVTSVLAQFGAWIPFTDVVQDTFEDNVLAEMTSLAGEQAGLTKERILWNMMIGGTAVIYAGAVANRGLVVAPISAADLQLAQKQLKVAMAKPITKMIDASVKIATMPVAPAYVAVGHTSFEQNLRAIPGFLPREQYAATTALLSDYEIGKYQDIRFILSPTYTYFAGAGGTSAVVQNTGGKADVFPMVIFGQDAFAATALKGQDSANVAVKNPKMASGDTDPLGQRGYIAWKMWYSAVRLNEAWVVRIEAAVS